MVRERTVHLDERTLAIMRPAHPEFYDHVLLALQHRIPRLHVSWCNAELAQALLQFNPPVDVLKLHTNAHFFHETDQDGSLFVQYLSQAIVEHALFDHHWADVMPRAMLEQLFRAIGRNPNVTRVATDDDIMPDHPFVPYGLDQMLHTTSSIVDLSVRPLDFGNDVDNDAFVRAIATSTLLTKLQLGAISDSTMACRVLDALHTHITLQELVIAFAPDREKKRFVAYAATPFCPFRALERLLVATRTLKVLQISNGIFPAEATFPNLPPVNQTTLEQIVVSDCQFFATSTQHFQEFVFHAAALRRVHVFDCYFYSTGEVYFPEEATSGQVVASILMAPPRPNAPPLEMTYDPGSYGNHGAANLAALVDAIASSDPRTMYRNTLVFQPRRYEANEYLQDLCRRLPEIGSLRHLRLNVSLSTPLLKALKQNFSLVTLETVDDATVTAEQQEKRMAYLERNQQLLTLMRTLPGNARIRPTLRVAAVPTGRLAHTIALRGLLALGDLK